MIIGTKKGKSNEIAGPYGSMLLFMVALLLVESRNVIGGLICPVNQVVKLSFLILVKLDTSPFFTFQNKKINLEHNFYRNSEFN